MTPNSYPQNIVDVSNLAALAFLQGDLERATDLYRQGISLAPTILQKAKLAIELAWMIGNLDQDQARREINSALEMLLPAEEDNNPEIMACRSGGQALKSWLEWDTNPEVGKRIAENAHQQLKFLTRDDLSFAGKTQAYFDCAFVTHLLGYENEAILSCEKFLQNELNDWFRIAGLSLYSEALRNNGRQQDSEQCLAEAIQHAKDYRPLLATLYFQQGTTQRGLKPASDNDFLQAQESFRQAQKSFRRALQCFDVDPYREYRHELQLSIYMNLAAVSFDLADFPTAIAAYERVVRSTAPDHPCHAEALLYLARGYANVKNFEEALKGYEKVLNASAASDAEKQQAQEGKALSLYEIGQYSLAIPALRKTMKGYKKSDARFMANLLCEGYCYEHLKDYNKAKACYEQIMRSPHALEEDKTDAMKRLSLISSVVEEKFGNA